MKKVIFLLLITLLAVGGLVLMPVEVRAGGNLLINEVHYDTTGQDSFEEWMEVKNIGNEIIDLSEYKIGDEESTGGSEGMWQWPVGAEITPSTTVIVAKDAVGFYNLYGKYPDFELNSADDNSLDFSETPDMFRYGLWGSGTISLTNTGDEVLLINAQDSIIDVLVYENGIFPGVTAHPGTGSGESLARINPADTDNCAEDFTILTNPTPGYDWIYRAEDYFSNTGLIEGTNDLYLSAKTESDDVGHMFYGPYTIDQSTGLYQANWRLRVNDNTNANIIARIDAFNSEGGGQWIYRDILGTDFVTAGEWQNFSLFFQRGHEGTMEYRVWFTKEANVDFDEVMVGKVNHIVWEAEKMAHQTGAVAEVEFGNGLSWTSEEGGHLVYGPYISLPAGFYNIKFISASDDIISTDQLLQIEAISNQNDYYKRSLNGLDFDEINMYQAGQINFVNGDQNKIWEFRLATTGFNEIRCDQVILTKSDNLVFEGENSPGFGETQTDISASGKQYRLADPTINDTGWMVYGPYLTLAPGNYQANYRIKIGASTNEVVGAINMADATGYNQEITVDLTGNDFDQLDQWQEFSHEFELTQPALMEWRVWFNDVVDLGVDRVEVDKIN